MTEGKTNMRIITITNQKGGVGKSTISLNIAYTLAKKGFKTLLIDADTQGSASAHLGINIDDLNVNGLHSLIDKIIEGERLLPSYFNEVIHTPVFLDNFNQPAEFGFDLIPSTKNLFDSELQMMLNSNSGIDPKLLDIVFKFVQKHYGITLPNANVVLNEDELKSALIKHERRIGNYFLNITQHLEKYCDYDFVIIDCPPNMGVMVLNAIFTNNCGVIIPTDKSLASVRGIIRVSETINGIAEKARQAFNLNHLGIMGILINRFKAKGLIDEELEHFISKFHPINLFNIKIPESSVAVSAEYAGRLLVQQSSRIRSIFEQLVDQLVESFEKEGI